VRFCTAVRTARPRALPQEGTISTPYDTRIDSALRINKRKSRIASAVIIALGLLVLLVVVLTGGRQRERAAGRVMVGDDSAAVVRLLGAPPHRCQPSNLAHLRDQFPGGTPRTTVDEELARLRGVTAGRWMYPQGEGCVPGKGATEIGMDRESRVVWVVAARNKTPLLYTGAAR
jgi:hypothetical protein